MDIGYFNNMPSVAMTVKCEANSMRAHVDNQGKNLEQHFELEKLWVTFIGLGFYSEN